MIDPIWGASRAEILASRFHEAYERLAPAFGYKTRDASAVPWNEVPEGNRRLMIAVCKELDAMEDPGASPMSIGDYALKLIIDGIESHAEDDLDEDGLLANEADHEAAVQLALRISRMFVVQPIEVMAALHALDPEIPVVPVDGGAP